MSKQSLFTEVGRALADMFKKQVRPGTLVVDRNNSTDFKLFVCLETRTGPVQVHNALPDNFFIGGIVFSPTPVSVRTASLQAIEDATCAAKWDEYDRHLAKSHVRVRLYNDKPSDLGRSLGDRYIKVTGYSGFTVHELIEGFGVMVSITRGNHYSDLTEQTVGLNSLLTDAEISLLAGLAEKAISPSGTLRGTMLPSNAGCIPNSLDEEGKSWREKGSLF